MNGMEEKFVQWVGEEPDFWNSEGEGPRKILGEMFVVWKLLVGKLKGDGKRTC